MKEIIFSDAYVAWRSEATLRETSLSVYDRVYSCYIDEYIGQKKVKEITQKDVDIICEGFKSRGFSPSYAQLVSSVLTDVFNWCIKEDYMGGFPFIIQINV